MMRTANSGESNVVLLIALFISSLLLIGVFVVVGKSRSSLLIADGALLTATYDRWREAGSPTGTNFEAFILGRRDGLAFDTNLYSVKGVTFHAALSLSNLMSDSGRLIVTVDRKLIHEKANGARRILQRVRPLGKGVSFADKPDRK